MSSAVVTIAWAYVGALSSNVACEGVREIVGRETELLDPQEGLAI
jgi:hypothetical protein